MPARYRIEEPDVYDVPEDHTRHGDGICVAPTDEGLDKYDSLDIRARDEGHHRLNIAVENPDQTDRKVLAHGLAAALG